MRTSRYWRRFLIFTAVAVLAVLMGMAQSARAVSPPGETDFDGPNEGIQSPVSGEGSQTGSGAQPGNPSSGVHDNGRGGNTYVNDPCLDPGPSPNAAAGSRVGVTQSETDLAVDGKNIVVGYNDSLGFYRNDGGLSGFSFSVNGGNTFIDGNGLPPAIGPGPGFPTPGFDHYLGDPSLVVNHATHTFYYASIYFPPTGEQTLSVNAGTFQSVPPQTQESVANTRCANDPTLRKIPDTTNLPAQKLVWGPPHVVVNDQQLNCQGPFGCDALDKEWLAIDQSTGELYITYTTFGNDGSTPIDLVRSKDGGVTWEGPFVIVPNLADAFNQATQAVITRNPVTGKTRIAVTWNSRRFSLVDGSEVQDSIQSAYSDDDGTTFTTPTTVSDVNPQGEPLGYNRGRATILNAPYINVDPNNSAVLYDTYFNGKTTLASGAFPYSKSGDILISKSVNGGASWLSPVKVNDDPGTTSHVFPSVQVDKHSNVYVAWTDRRDDPANIFTNIYAAVSHDGGASFGHNKVQTDIATTWFARTDAAPNFGDYNSSELLGDNQFVTTWADGRFMPPYCTGTEPFCFTLPGGSGGVTRNRPATPDSMFTIANGLGVGN
ncbi:MAG TPA: sialidase family protein [Gaiellaceae bacterium]